MKMNTKYLIVVLIGIFVCPILSIPPVDYMKQEGADTLKNLSLRADLGEHVEPVDGKGLSEYDKIVLHNDFVCPNAIAAIKAGNWGRQVHPKQHGCIRGEFRVLSKEEGFPAEFETDLYRPGTVYPTLIRYSTGGGPFETPSDEYNSKTDFQTDPKWGDDQLPSPKAVAFKLFDAPEQKPWVPWKRGGRTQDMLWVSPFIPFVRSVDHSWGHVEALVGGAKAFKSWLLGKEQRGDAYRVARALLKGTNGILTDKAFTMASSFVHGKSAAQYILIPCKDNKHHGWKITNFRSHDMFRERLIGDLDADETCYDVKAMLWKSKTSTPVEPRDTGYRWGYNDGDDDPNDLWNYKTIAKVVIPKQKHGASWGTERQEGWCRELSFNSWHTSTHRPLGSLERIRHKMYSNAQRHRQETAGFSTREPTKSTFNAIFPVNYSIA